MTHPTDFRKGYRIIHRLTRLSMAVLLMALAACTSEIDLIYESPGRPVVYCLLNPLDSIQYLRVSRSFIVRGNPDGQAISPDSLVIREDFYAYLECEKPDGTREISYFTLSDISRRDSGLFPHEGLVVFETRFPVEGGKTYGLYVNFPGIPKIVAGSVTAVKPVEILDPVPIPGRELTLLPDQGCLLRWSSSIPFAVYQPVIRLIWLEGDKNFQVRKQLDLPQNLYYGDVESELLTTWLNGASFIADIAAGLAPPDSGMRRKIIGFDLLMTTGGPELSAFSRSGQNAINAFTGLDEFSNLDGAVGIYSSITRAGSYNNRFSDITINHLADGAKTKHLGFMHFTEDFRP